MVAIKLNDDVTKALKLHGLKLKSVQVHIFP